jgi:hypothetical protein
MCGLTMLALAVGSLSLANAAANGVPRQVVTPSPIDDHFAFRATLVDGSVSTRAQVNDTAGGTAGTAFSAENDFGLPKDVRQLRAEFMFRLHDRAMLRVSALDLSRHGSVVLNRVVRYGKQNLQINDRVNSLFDWRMFDFTGTYSLLRNDRFELGAGLGMHFIQAESIATVPARGIRESFDGAGPFVTLALDGTWRISQRFSLNARYQAFDLTVSDVSARLSDAHADLQFRWRPSVAFGLGYQSNNVHLNLPKENPGGSMQLDVSGPELFVRVSF